MGYSSLTACFHASYSPGIYIYIYIYCIYGCPFLPRPQPGHRKKGQNAGNHSAYKGKPDVRVEFLRISYTSIYFHMIPCIFPISSYIFLGFPISGRLHIIYTYIHRERWRERERERSSGRFASRSTCLLSITFSGLMSLCAWAFVCLLCSGIRD